jgi:hypothetical protein
VDQEGLIEIPNPMRFGRQPAGDYLPSPREIKTKCVRIQSRWSLLEKTRRATHFVDPKDNRSFMPQGWVPPCVDDSMVEPR